MLLDQDHIQICKPGSRSDEAYAAVKQVVDQEQKKVAEAAAAIRMDTLPPAVSGGGS